MSPLSLVVAVLAAGSIFAFVAFFMSGSSSSEATQQRLNRYAGDVINVTGSGAIDEVKAPTNFRDIFGRLTGALNPLLARTSRTSRLADELQRADLRIKSSEWLLAVVCLGLLLGLGLLLRFGSSVMLAVGLVVVWVVSRVFLRVRQHHRLNAFNGQLGDTILLISNSLKAGYSFGQAMATVGKSASAPIGTEFTRATREVQLGITVDDALTHMVARNQSEDLDLLITAVKIQHVVGGNLAEILDTIAFTIRERVRIQGEIRTLTAQARMSGWIITGLPIALAAFLNVISPSYFQPMLTHSTGLAVLGVGVVSLGIGVFLMQKLVKIEV